jgi:ABC-2 type transport system ATP-binding protein
VELVGLSHRQKEKVSVYSHGMRQRLGLAQALLPNPKLVILDEPLDGLDPNGIRELRDVMLRVVREKEVTIFMSSHILSEVELTCNRVVVIHEGNRMFEGTTKELMTDTRGVRVRTAGEKSPAETLAGLPFIERAEQVDGHWTLAMDHAMAPELTRRLVQAEIEVLEITPIRQRLEDVFIGLTQTGAGAAGEKK